MTIKINSIRYKGYVIKIQDLIRSNLGYCLALVFEPGELVSYTHLGQFRSKIDAINGAKQFIDGASWN